MADRKLALTALRRKTKPCQGGYLDQRSYRENGKADEEKAERRVTGKKPYKDPAFRHEKVFETMALACGKVEPTNFSCRFKRMSS
jgi:hypothetical protein